MPFCFSEWTFRNKKRIPSFNGHENTKKKNKCKEVKNNEEATQHKPNALPFS